MTSCQNIYEDDSKQADEQITLAEIHSHVEALRLAVGRDSPFLRLNGGAFEHPFLLAICRIVFGKFFLVVAKSECCFLDVFAG